MSRFDYDVVTVGGGLGGSALARVLAARGVRVLVLEREQRFADRVRGEVLAPWGVAEMRALQLDELLRSAGAHDLPWFNLFYLGAQVARRDLIATTPQGLPWQAFYHPAMQEQLIGAAQAAGAEVNRGVRVRGVCPGPTPIVVSEREGRVEEISARLVVGADGRGSMVRKWGGFEVRRGRERHLFSGVLFAGHTAPDDSGAIFFDSPRGRLSLLFPQGQGRVRAYVGYHLDGQPPARAGYDVTRFIEESVGSGVPIDWYAHAQAIGPLAMFDATDEWVERP